MNAWPRICYRPRRQAMPGSWMCSGRQAGHLMPRPYSAREDHRVACVQLSILITCFRGSLARFSATRPGTRRHRTLARKATAMRKIVAGLFMSLDGVVEAPEKWTGPYFNDEVGQAVGALMAANDAMLLGRTTYEGFAAAFGGQSGGMADQMNNTPKFVVSTTLTSAGWQNSTLISGGGDDVA